MAFRPVEREIDRPFLQRLFASTRAEEMAVVPWSDAEKAAFLDMQFRAQDQHYRIHYAEADWLVILQGDTPIGRLYLDRRADTDHILDISLLAEHRGGGLGTALLSDLLDGAAGSGRTVTIHVEKFNPAMRLYQRLGFVKIEDAGIYDMMRWPSG